MFRRGLATAVATLAATVALAPIASAEPGGTYVSFGDSFAANPGHLDTVPTAGGCPNAKDNYAAHVAEATGLEHKSYSCNGAVAYLPHPQKLLSGQVGHALADGALNESTKLVTISIGANDGIQGQFLSPELQDRFFTDSVKAEVTRIKEAAPNAQVQLVGYPAFTTVEMQACPVNVFGFAPQMSVPLARDIEMGVQKRQQRVAAETGSTFVDMKQASPAVVAMCGPEGSRHMSAMIDSDVTQWNMPAHPTKTGSKVIAEQVVAHYGA